ncbi:MAG TPA: FGGY-family carbohydrate kinase, partial [Cellulomonas sp.]
SGTNLLDITTRRWSAPVVAGTGVPARLLGPVLAPDEDVGPVHYLLPSGVRAEAVTGLGDEFAEALAVGLLDPGPLVVVIGTSGALLGVQDQPSAGVFCHATADRWLRLDSLHGAGMSLSWFRDTFAPGLDLDALTAEAAGVAPGADGLVFLPYLAGDRSTAGASARAGFLGARPSHTRAHFVRAVLEGVALELRRVATVRMGVVRPTQVVLKGGGARSALWAQIVADVFDAPLATSARTAASGALDVAGVGARWWDYTELAARATRTSVEPSADAGRYPAVFDHFVGTVAAVLGV